MSAAHSEPQGSPKAVASFTDFVRVFGDGSPLEASLTDANAAVQSVFHRDLFQSPPPLAMDLLNFAP